MSSLFRTPPRNYWPATPSVPSEPVVYAKPKTATLKLGNNGSGTSISTQAALFG
jgi:hypothetical protein